MFHVAESFRADISSPKFYPQSAWYAVYTRSRFEKRVAGELSVRSVENYLPLVEQIHQWKDRRKLVEVPLFAGYVFVRLTDSHRSRIDVLRTLGVVRFLGNVVLFKHMTAYEIHSVQRLLSARVPCSAYPFLREGAWVLVKRGPLRNLEGFLTRLKNQTRLVVSIDMLSQSVGTEIDARDVEVIPPPALR